MIKKLRGYAGIAIKLAKGETVSNVDYANGYDRASGTYGIWLERMSGFTDRIIGFEDRKNEGVEILDLACGTGYVSLKMSALAPKANITAVDISEGMLQKLKDKSGGRIETVNMDACEFLKSAKGKYDRVFFAWALPYFRHSAIFKLIADSLKPGGALHVISNCKGTLSGIEQTFLNVMIENPNQLSKPMPIMSSLPDGENGLVNWAKEAGFEAVMSGKDEVNVQFESAQQLLEWLENTGVLAGCRAIFKNYDGMRPIIEKELERTNFLNGKYIVNHRFAYGIFKKAGDEE